MKTIISLILFLTVFAPTTALAHGGVEKTAGDVTIVLNQDPLSPFAGEAVKMNFTFLDTKRERLKNFTATLTLTDTFMGDASKDKVVLTQPVQTDVNGDYEFDYTFNKANYFDIDLDLKDSSGTDQSTGFLVQTRDKTISQNSSSSNSKLGIGIAVGLAIGLVINRARKGKGQ